jgi:hypothetical protein
MDTLNGARGRPQVEFRLLASYAKSWKLDRTTRVGYFANVRTFRKTHGLEHLESVVLRFSVDDGASRVSEKGHQGVQKVYCM